MYQGTQLIRGYKDITEAYAIEFVEHFNLSGVLFTSRESPVLKCITVYIHHYGFPKKLFYL